MLSSLRRLVPSFLRRQHVVPASRPRWHSVSSCSEYERCPRRYRYAYVDRLGEDRPVPASWRHGSAVHSALEAAYRAHVPGEPLGATETIAVNALCDAWISEGLADDPEWRARSEGMVRTVLANDRLHADQILGVEHGFRADAENGLHFTGFADLVLRRDATTVEIVDHKVTRYASDEATLQNDPQLNLYAWFARREWPWSTHVLATHHYPVLDQIVTVEITDSSMTQAVARLTEIATQAEADTSFVPRPGPECSNCPWISRCPAHAQEGSPTAAERVA
jgi:putative RecB family exonuclease